MKAWVIDTETNTKNVGDGAVGDMAASPYFHENHIVLIGEKQLSHDVCIFNYGIGAKHVGSLVTTFPASLTAAKTEPILLIGQNISFDLKYLMKDYPDLWDKVRHNIFIWDTQQVAYILSGQTHMYPSLDELSSEIGLELKDEKIKEYWEAGVDTADIPICELMNYLDTDVLNTEAVFKYQYAIVSELPHLFNLVRVKMDDVLATTMMEWEGMQFDLSVAHKHIVENEVRMAIAMSHITDMVKGLFHSKFWFNPLSNDHVSLAMFGGTYFITEDVVINNPDGSPVLYKTGKRAGQPKTKREDVPYYTAGFGLTPPAGSELKKKGFYSTSDEVLSKFSGLEFAQIILRIRELTKETETYYRGYSKLVWPDGRIHPSINHSATRTGRQSCTKPNLQNVTRETE